METIIFADLEEALITDLTYKLGTFGSSASAYGAIPNPRPSEFVVVKRTGGPRKNLVTDSAQVTFDAWAATASAAYSLMALVRGSIGALQGQTISGIQIHRVSEAAGPGLMPDPSTALSRYVFTASMDVRGSAR